MLFVVAPRVIRLPSIRRQLWGGLLKKSYRKTGYQLGCQVEIYEYTALMEKFKE